MSRSHQSFDKRQKEKRKAKRKEEKRLRKEQRQEENVDGNNLDDMIAYVDEFGNITDTPPEERTKEEEIDAEDIVLGIPPKEEEDPKINKGRVSFYDNNKGYGFITDMDSGEKFFFHINNVIEGVINENEIVTFDIAKGRKGMDAVNIMIFTETKEE